MKLSFMTFSTPELTLAETLAAAATYGYDGIEPRVGCGHKHGLEYDATPEARRDAVRMAADAGVAFSCVATSCMFADPAGADVQLADARLALQLAADIGAPCIRVFGGPIPEGTDRDRAVWTVSSALSALAQEAGELGVIVCMETHDDWCDPRHVAAVMARVGHPAIAVNWDVMHPVRTGLATVDESFEMLRPWIRHLHVHDGASDDALRMVPMGTGVIDNRRAVELLSETGFSGYLSGEWINWEPWQIHLPREIATLREYISGV